MTLTHITEVAERLGCSVFPDTPMAAATTFRIGGPARLLLQLPNAQAAQEILPLCHKEGLPVLLLGNGSNLLVSDSGFPGVVLRLDGKAEPTLREETLVSCPAGLSLQRLCLFARDRGLSGLEFAFGIPGTVGGALFMNAGAYGGEMADVVTEATALSPTGELRRYSAEQLALTYRHSRFSDQSPQEQELILEVTFRLTPAPAEDIDGRMKELSLRRREKQPLEYPSAGSFFKRPEGYFAAALLDECGLKGYRVGDAQISEKHAGFVVNRGKATAAQVMALCRHAQATVRNMKQVELVPEVRLVGAFDEPEKQP